MEEGCGLCTADVHMKGVERNAAQHEPPLEQMTDAGGQGGHREYSSRGKGVWRRADVVGGLTRPPRRILVTG